MKPKDEEFERIAQRHLAALKKSTKATTEDAAVRAVHKVMAEFDAKSDTRLMEMPNSSMAWQEGYEAGRLAEREACADLVWPKLKVWSEEELTAMGLAFNRAQEKHGWYETLMAVGASVLKLKAAAIRARSNT